MPEMTSPRHRGGACERGAAAVEDVTISVVEILPDVGVTVEIHIETPLVGGLASLIPLPGGGSIVTDFSQRLQDVTISDVMCA